MIRRWTTFIARFFIALTIVSGMLLIPSVACTPQSTQAPTPAPSPPAIPVAPVLIQPTNESTVSGLTVKLEWNPSPDAASYRLQVSTDSAFTKLALDKAGITGTYYELTSGLNWKTNYYWRVNATNASGTSPWSEQWKFITPVLQLNKIAFTSLRDGNAEIYVMNADGSNQTRLTNNPANDSWPNWSPDGTTIAFQSNRDGNFEIYVMNADGSNQTRLTNNKEGNFCPAWSPDGTKVVFISNRDGNSEVYIMNVDGTNQLRLTKNTGIDQNPTWSPDGTKIVFSAIGSGGTAEIYIMNPDGSNQTAITKSAMGTTPSYSPDGVKIAFTSLRDGNQEIYVMNPDGSNQTRLTNNLGIDSFPSWSPDGTKIAFSSNRNAPT